MTQEYDESLHLRNLDQHKAEPYSREVDEMRQGRAQHFLSGRQGEGNDNTEERQDQYNDQEEAQDGHRPEFRAQLTAKPHGWVSQSKHVKEERTVVCRRTYVRGKVRSEA